jgi:DivIVA domain-containing protein
MDVTPQELRDTDIRESFRGYHRDEVDELLERAAATIEHLEHQIRILQERLAAAPGPQAAPAAEPAAPPAPRPIPVPDSDVIQRTLILAQKAADEAVAEAQARSQQLLSESETKAQVLVSEAESTARRIAESERRRIEAEIAELGVTRDQLRGDCDALDRFAAEYRDRLRRAVEAELAHLEQSSAPPEPPPRPDLASDDITFAPAVVEPEPTMAVDAVAPVEAAPAAVGVEVGEVPEAAAPDEYPAAPAAYEPPSWDAAAGGDETWSPDSASGWAESEAGAESLDDDAFFASLRDAVRDDEALGPRDDDYYDADDTDSGKRLFRRRR